MQWTEKIFNIDCNELDNHLAILYFTELSIKWMGFNVTLFLLVFGKPYS